MGLLFLGVVEHWTTRAKGAEAVSRAWMAVSMTGRTSRSKFQGDSSFYYPRGKVYKGTWGFGLEGLIGHNMTPSYHMGGKEDTGLHT